MDNATLLAAPTTEPSVSMRRASDGTVLLRSTAAGIVRRQRRIVGPPSAALLKHVRGVTTLATSATLWAIRLIFAQSLFASALAIQLARTVLRSAWSSKPVKKLRKKVAFEFIALVLGPGGNMLFLMIFWPGWWFLAGLAWLVWTCSR
jgi:hypothetical protein